MVGDLAPLLLTHAACIRQFPQSRFPTLNYLGSFIFFQWPHMAVTSHQLADMASTIRMPLDFFMIL